MPGLAGLLLANAGAGWLLQHEVPHTTLYFQSSSLSNSGDVVVWRKAAVVDLDEARGTQFPVRTRLVGGPLPKMVSDQREQMVACGLSWAHLVQVLVRCFCHFGPSRRHPSHCFHPSPSPSPCSAGSVKLWEGGTVRVAAIAPCPKTLNHLVHSVGKWAQT